MGKSIPCSVTFQEFAVRLSSENPTTGARPGPKPASRTKTFVGRTRETRVEISDRVKLKEMESNRNPNPNSNSNSSSNPGRMPLGQVVEDCVKRWFEDTLKEAKAGDVGMQVLVGQMYCSGYGVPKDEHKGRAWINRASRTRSSAWQVSDKHPGYNASDSDSNGVKE